MQRLRQSPTDPAFVQDPWPFYDRARAAGKVVWWEDYGMPAVFGQAAANAILRDAECDVLAWSGRRPAA